MKRFCSILIIVFFALTPVLAFATEPEENQELQPAPVTENENSPQSQSDIIPQEPAVEQDTPTPSSDSNESEDIEATPSPSVDEPNEEKSNEDESKEDTSHVEKAQDDSGNTDKANDSDIDENKNDDKETDEDEEDKEDEEDTEDEHTHSFEYISNDDGTHTVKCTESIESVGDDEEITSTDCTYEDIEKCEYNEYGICIYCGYEKPEEEIEFDPSINVSIINQSCVIGRDNPVICLDISQDDYDVEYAQICFANYNKSKFINVGLMHGKYKNRKTDEYVYTNDNLWYSSPNISDYYEEGTYSIRSIYARCTSGDYIHYSLESDTLSDELQDITISLLEATDEVYDEPENKSETDSFTFTEDPSVEEHINHNPSIENPPETAAPNEDSIIENPTPEERTNDITVENQATEIPVVEKPAAEEPEIKEPVVEKPTVEEPVMEEPVVEEPTTEKPIVKKPTEDKSSLKNATVEKPVVEKPTVGKPIEEKPTAKKPTEDKPATQKPASEKTVAEKPAAEEPAAEKPEIKEPVAEEPAVETPTEEKPVVEEPASNSSKGTNEAEPESIPKKIVNQILNFIKRIFGFW